MAWNDIWKGVENIRFGKEPYEWKFYGILLGDYDFRNKRVLELGCGTGINSILMGLRGARVTVLDKSREALVIVKKQAERVSVDVETIHSDVFDSDFKNEFSLVHSEGLVEHFIGEKRQRIVNTHARAAKKGGLVLLIVPHSKCPFYRFGKLLAEISGSWAYGSEYPYSKPELKRRVELAGLKPGKIIGGEALFALVWAFAALGLSSSRLMRKSISMPASREITKLNYNNFFAERWGRVIGCVGEKV